MNKNKNADPTGVADLTSTDPTLNLGVVPEKLHGAVRLGGEHMGNCWSPRIWKAVCGIPSQI